MSNGINALIAQGGWKQPQFDVMETAKNALLMRRAKQEIETYPEERNWLREQRGMERTKFGQEQAAEQRRLDWEPFTDEVTAIKGLKEIIPLLNESNWDASMEHLGTIKKISKSLLPSLASLKQQAVSEGTSPEQFPQWLEDYKMKKVNALDYYKAQTERVKATKEKEEARPEVVKLVDQLNSMDKNDPNRPFIQGRLKKLSETSGFQIEIDKDGNIRIVQGPIGSGTMTKPMQTKVQEKLFNAQEQLSRVKTIENMFKPEYQKIATRGEAWWSGVKSKLGVDLSKEETKNLTNFSAYKRTSIANINLYIKEITGAQMSEAEANRLRLAMPDPGEGIFGGDNPISFKAKLDDVTKEIKASIHRYEKLIKDGFTPEEINKMAKTDSLPNLNKFYSIEVPNIKSPKERAIEELKKRGKVVNEQTIERAMSLLEAE